MFNVFKIIFRGLGGSEDSEHLPPSNWGVKPYGRPNGYICSGGLYRLPDSLQGLPPQTPLPSYLQQHLLSPSPDSTDTTPAIVFPSLYRSSDSRAKYLVDLSIPPHPSLSAAQRHKYSKVPRSFSLGGSCSSSLSSLCPHQPFVAPGLVPSWSYHDLSDVRGARSITYCHQQLMGFTDALIARGHLPRQGPGETVYYIPCLDCDDVWTLAPRGSRPSGSRARPSCSRVRPSSSSDYPRPTRKELQEFKARIADYRLVARSFLGITGTYPQIIPCYYHHGGRNYYTMQFTRAQGRASGDSSGRMAPAPRPLLTQEQIREYDGSITKAMTARVARPFASSFKPTSIPRSLQDPQKRGEAQALAARAKLQMMESGSRTRLIV